jgi:hypothetical protein
VTSDNGSTYGGKIVSKSQGLLIIFMGTAITLLLMLGSVFAAPHGTVILDPPTATKSGLPGTTVTYTLWFTNSGGTASITDTFTLDHEGNQWPVDLSRTEILLPGSASTDVVVSVTIPFAANTTHDTVTITVSYQGSLLLPVSRLTTNFYRTYLPIISKPEDVCRPTGENYGALSVEDWQAAERQAELHGDLNLSLRGYVPTTADLRLVDIPGSTDAGAPQLAGLFAPSRPPDFTSVYRVNNWNWGCNCRGDPIEDVEVSLADLAAIPGETVHVPDRSGGDIGDGYKALVLYASSDRLTIKYTRKDAIADYDAVHNYTYGYAIHFENVCVDANLLAHYQELNNAGRHELPALQAGQPIGRARSNHVGVSIRDAGAFMDPRSRKDWWHGY